MKRQPKQKTTEAAPPLRLEWRSPAELTQNPRNWRTHPEAQQKALAGILSEVGWAGACLFNERTGLLIDGHLRQKVAVANGAEQIPVLIGDWSPEQEAKILATLDPVAAMATADPVKLDALLKEVDTGCAEVQQMLADLWEETQADAIADTPAAPVDEDTPPEPRADVVTRPGDLWTIGQHRLLAGDCTQPEAVARLLDGAKPMLMVTDPPYGVKLDQSWRDKALGDKAMGPGNMNLVASDDRADWSEAWALFPGDVAYVWHAGRFSDVVMTSLRSAGLEICQQLIWNKSIMVMGRSDYHFKHEPCWYAVRKGRTHRWIGDRKQTTVIDAKSPNHIMSGSEEEQTEHPTQKPVECMAYLIRNHDAPEVYDPFVGSGTTIMACEALGRRCFACEIEPAYVDVCLRRYVAKYPDADPVRHDGTKWSELTA